jgi:uncharacterized membrane protein YhaH (DUF805 family)
MGFQDAVTTCFSKYVDFQGRASRPEYWWWVLFVVVVGIVLRVVGQAIFGWASAGAGIPGLLFHLAVFLPGLAVAVRRLHDTDRSGWWLLIAFIPVIGWLVLLYFMIQPGTPSPNLYGDGVFQT